MARTDTPSSDPIPRLEEWQKLHMMAFEAEQAIAEIIAISKVAADGLSDSIQIFDGQGQRSMFDAKHTIRALTRLLESVYDNFVYPVSIQLSDLIDDMEQPTESPKERE
jgi:hypothetical protein